MLHSFPQDLNSVFLFGSRFSFGFFLGYWLVFSGLGFSFWFFFRTFDSFGLPSDSFCLVFLLGIGCVFQGSTAILKRHRIFKNRSWLILVFTAFQKFGFNSFWSLSGFLDILIDNINSYQSTSDTKIHRLISLYKSVIALFSLFSKYCNESNKTKITMWWLLDFIS